MARKLKLKHPLDEGGGVWYVPKFGNERFRLDNDLMDEGEEPLAVRLRPISASEFRRLSLSAADAKAMERIAKGADADEIGGELAGRVIASAVLEVRGYEDVKGEAVTTGRDLVDRGEAGLVNEITVVIQDHAQLSDGVRKLYPSPQD